MITLKTCAHETREEEADLPFAESLGRPYPARSLISRCLRTRLQTASMPPTRTAYSRCGIGKREEIKPKKIAIQ
jgi:hypothetical protein